MARFVMGNWFQRQLGPTDALALSNYVIWRKWAPGREVMAHINLP